MLRLNAIFNSDLLPIGILALIVIEASVLLWWQRRQRRSPADASNRTLLVTFLGAGGSLVAAMAFHRRDEAAPEWFALAMLCALVLHIWHLAVLLRR